MVLLKSLLLSVVQLEMILQADEYEAEQSMDLQDFFDSTKGRFKTELGKSWAEEIVRRRADRQNSSKFSRQSMS